MSSISSSRISQCLCRFLRWPCQFIWRHRILALATCALLVLGALLLNHRFPFQGDELATYSESVTLLDRNGQVLRSTLSPDEQRCFPISLEQAGDWMPLALIAVEDKRFFNHPGLDPIAISRAVVQNTSNLRRISGASTISTQVIRLTEPRERTLRTKVIEAFRALQMEAAIDKESILEQYLNRTPYGGNRLGVRAASLHYFAKEPCDLALPEAALLAGLPQSPERLRPDRNPTGAKKRRDFVLERMLANEWIDQAQHDAAVQAPIELRDPIVPFSAPHFCEMVLDTPLKGSVTTSLDLDWQHRVEDHLLAQRPNWQEKGIFGAAAVVLDVASGEIRALVGSPDFRDQDHAGQVNAATAKRSPGSSLKPFAYALAIEKGMLTPQLALADLPMALRGYVAGNYDRTFSGMVPAREALARSLNLPALRVTQKLGVEPFLTRLRELGFETLDQPASHYGLNLVLGGCDVRLVDLVNATACLARGGEFLPWQLRSQVHSQDVPLSGSAKKKPAIEWQVSNHDAGDDLDRAGAGKHLFSSETCFLMWEMLTQDRAVVANVAWKTGTSAAHRDAWCVAYDAKTVVGVWLGNPNRAPASSLVGVEVAAPLAHALFDLLRPEGGEGLATPSNLVRRSVCARSGHSVSPHCPQAVDAWAVDVVSHSDVCSVHRSQGGGEQWPAELARALTSHGHPHDQSTSAGGAKRAKRANAAVRGDALRILSPVPGETFALTSRTTEIPLRAQTSAHRIFWFVNGIPLGSVDSGEIMMWDLQLGRHEISCGTADGARKSLRIRVESPE